MKNFLQIQRGLTTALCLALICALQAKEFLVTNTNNDGAGSLRQAIEDANNNPQPPHKIKFKIPDPLDPITAYDQDFSANNGGFMVSSQVLPPNCPWAYQNALADCATPACAQVWCVNGQTIDINTPTDSELTGPQPTFIVPRDDLYILSFTHSYNFQQGFDGGQVRVKINNGPFQIVKTGYTIDALAGQGILNGQPAFTGSSHGMVTSGANLGNLSAGDEITLQFVGSWDGSNVADAPNWLISHITVKTPTVPVIQPLSSYVITQRNVCIDGYSQPGAKPNCLEIGDNAVIKIIIDGNGAGFDGIVFNPGADNGEVAGLNIRNFADPNLFFGIGINILAQAIKVVGNFVGTDETGQFAIGQNVFNTVVDFGGSAFIGSAARSDRNLSAGSSDANILTFGPATIKGNYIGINANATQSLAYTSSLLSVGDGTVIGGPECGAGNVIAGDSVAQIEIEGSNCVVQGNLVGTNGRGTETVGTTRRNLRSFGFNLLVGGTQPGAKNVFALTADPTQGSINLSILGDSTKIIGNSIGVNAQGTQLLGASANGLVIFSEQTVASKNVIAKTPFGLPQNRNVETQGFHDQIIDNLIGVTSCGSEVLGEAYYNIIDFGAFTEIKNNTIAGAGRSQSLGVLQVHGAGIGLFGISMNALIVGNNIGTNSTATSALPNARGIRLLGCTAAQIGGISAEERNIINGDIYSLAGIEGSNDSDTLIQGNFIGIDGCGKKALGATTTGIRLLGSRNCTIGGLTGGGNSISGCSRLGIEISGASNTQILGNYVGTDATGTKEIGNGTGIQTYNSTGTLIRGNVVSSNGEGISINTSTESSDASCNEQPIISGNKIGTDVGGRKPLGNKKDGIRVDLFDVAAQIGGPLAADRNIISGNCRHGLLLTTGSDNNLIQNNYIGTDVTAMHRLANHHNGIQIGLNQGASNNDSIINNIISGNQRDGINIIGSSAATIQSNIIGSNNCSDPLANCGNGIAIACSANNLIGNAGLNILQGNRIAHNKKAGVAVGERREDIVSIGNAILTNSIFKNKIGIDLGRDGITANHVVSPTPGPNDFQNKPILTSAILTIDGMQTIVTGSLQSIPSSSFRIEVFNNRCNQSEGAEYIGSINITTDGTGFAEFTAPLLPAAIDSFISATATRLGTIRETSEFSANVKVSQQLVAANESTIHETQETL